MNESFHGQNILHIPSPSRFGVLHDARQAIGLAVVIGAIRGAAFWSAAHVPYPAFLNSKAS